MRLLLGLEGIPFPRDARDQHRTSLAWAPVEGGAVRRVAQLEPYASLDWSPDSLYFLVRGLLGRDSREWWSIPAEGGAPQPVGISGTVGGLAMSPQGDRIAFVLNQRGIELWLYRNLLPTAPAQQ